MEPITLKILNEFGDSVGITLDDIEIVEGGANGADKLGQKFARIFKLENTTFIPLWDKLGKSAGHISISNMASYAAEAEYKILIAFWNGKSKGTESMINVAKRKGLKVFVVDTTTFEIEELN